jgi:hypothetical protein
MQGGRPTRAPAAAGLDSAAGSGCIRATIDLSIFVAGKPDDVSLSAEMILV